MNKQELWWIFGGVLTILLGAVIFVFSLNENTNKCTDNNGILVKSVDGYICIDREVVIRHGTD